MITFKEFLFEKTQTIKERLILLVLNSYLYKQHINESFQEASDIYKGKKGLISKYAIRFNSFLKSRSIKEIDNFESRYMDKLSFLIQNYKNKNWMEMTDVEFIENLDLFLNRTHRVFNSTVFNLNSIETTKEYEEFKKQIGIEVLEKMIEDFIKFRTNIIEILETEVQEYYISVVGNEAKRIEKSRNKKFLEINIDPENLEESGADILFSGV